MPQRVSPGRTTTVWKVAGLGRRSGAARVEPPSAAPACPVTTTTPSASTAVTMRRRRKVAGDVRLVRGVATRSGAGRVMGNARTPTPVTVVTAAIPLPGSVVIETSRPRGCDNDGTGHARSRGAGEGSRGCERLFAIQPRTPVRSQGRNERVFAPNACSCYRASMSDLTPRQRQVLEFIDTEVRERGYPPSVREIGEAVGLSSSSTVHAHLAALQEKGYLVRDPTKPRALEVHLDIESGAPIERRPVRHVPL